MSDFTFLLNTCGGSYEYEFKKLCDLEIDKIFKTSNFTIIKTRYGNKLSVILDDKFKIILPDRFMNIIKSEEDLENLNSKTYNLIYKGKKSLNNGNFFHEIKFE